ncbi:hypothetical protein N9L68_05915 [bacterium]|nr:hypothetical protein [bacterium]
METAEVEQRPDAAAARHGLLGASVGETNRPDIVASPRRGGVMEAAATAGSAACLRRSGSGSGPCGSALAAAAATRLSGWPQPPTPMVHDSRVPLGSAQQGPSGSGWCLTGID